MASKVIAAKGFKKVAILHDNSSYAKGLAEEAQKGLKDAGVPVVFYDALTPSERDYTAILTKLKAADPDSSSSPAITPKRVCCSARRRKCIGTCP